MHASQSSRYAYIISAVNRRNRRNCTPAKRLIDFRFVGEITLSEHLRRMREKRWRNATKEERQKAASLAGRAAWANLTPEERSVEMKRRAKVRNQNRARKAKS